MVEIVERLAHAHQHDIGDLALRIGKAAWVGCLGAGPVTEPVAGERDLSHDLARGQIAHETLRAGVTERAGERAADLARNAKCAAVLFGDVDGLDLLAVGEAKQPFARAVDRDLLGHDPGPRERKRRGKLAAKLLGDVGHDGEIRRAAHIRPAPDLAHAHAPLAFGNAERAKTLA